MKVLLLDNYDSFTWNLHHLLDAIDGIDITVKRNDEIGIGAVEKFDRILISPGPGLPAESGITLEVIKKYMHLKPILGVCLGMQSLAQACGGRLKQPGVFHGVSTKTTIRDAEEKLFSGIPSPFLTGRYHSWMVDEHHVPSVLRVTAVDEDGRIMGMRHDNNLLRGIQFHPESILTEFGNKLITNWLFKC